MLIAVLLIQAASAARPPVSADNTDAQVVMCRALRHQVLLRSLELVVDVPKVSFPQFLRSGHRVANYLNAHDELLPDVDDDDEFREWLRDTEFTIKTYAPFYITKEQTIFRRKDTYSIDHILAISIARCVFRVCEVTGHCPLCAVNSIYNNNHTNNN